MRALALTCTLVVLTAACGSRVEGDGTSQGLGPTTTATGTSTPTGPTFGDQPAPCGPAEAIPSDEIGVTDDTIKLGVITDRKSTIVPGINEGLWYGMLAFSEWCNSLGGVAGRTIELVEYNADIFRYRDAVLAACDEVFALVGGGGIQDNLGAQEVVDCGLAEIAGVTVNSKKSGSDRVYEPLPNPASSYPAGAALRYLEEFPEIAEHAAYVYTDIPIGAFQRDKHMQAYEQLGFDFIAVRATEINETNWRTVVQELQRQGVEYVSMTTSPEELRNFLKAMGDADWKPTVFDLEANFYDQKLIDASGADAEGLFVRVSMWPYEEADLNPATAQLVQLLQDEAEANPSLLATHSFSAGLLFATAIGQVQGDLTRDSLLDAVRGIHEWTGLGLHGPGDPGGEQPSNCFIILRIQDGAYRRWYPATPDAGDDGYACDPDARLDIDVTKLANYEPGASEG